MSLLSSPSSLLLPKPSILNLRHSPSLSLSLLHSPSLSSLHLPSSRTFSSFSASTPSFFPDEQGNNSDPEPETIRFWADDEPGPVSTESEVGAGDDVAVNSEMKRALVDSVYGTLLGFRASVETRAEVSELVTKLEALNPNPNPTEVPGLLDGNWILLYTAHSELLPLLAVGSTPLLKVDKISQNIDTGSQIVENSTTLSSPFATFSFSASASFEVRSPSRIQVQFKEATFKPPEIKSHFDIPESVDIFGQEINLSSIQPLLKPVEEAAAGISRTLYGLPPLKLSIPGERTRSWLLISYLDEDLRISRGDGGLFVLVREGSSLLEQ